MSEDVEPCMCGTGFTCLARKHMPEEGDEAERVRDWVSTGEVLREVRAMSDRTCPSRCAATHPSREHDETTDGCACHELCAMGPTCPGANAGLDRGCWRTKCDHPTPLWVDDETGWRCYDCGFVVGHLDPAPANDSELRAAVRRISYDVHRVCDRRWSEHIDDGLQMLCPGDEQWLA